MTTQITQTLLEKQTQLEDKWIARAMANSFDGKGTYGIYTTYFSHRVKTKKDLTSIVKERMGWGSHAKTKEKREIVKMGSMGIAQRIFKKLKAEEKWDIYFPDLRLHVYLTDDEISDSLTYEPYDGETLIEPVRKVANEEHYQVKLIDHSSSTASSMTYPYVRASVLSRNKGFKCTVTKRFGETAIEIEYEIYSKKNSYRVPTIEAAVKLMEKHIATWESISIKGGITLDYNDEDKVNLAPKALGALITNQNGEYYLASGKYIYIMSSYSKTLVENSLGLDYGLPVIQIPGTKYVMYALMPIGWMKSHLHRSMLKGKRELKNK